MLQSMETSGRRHPTQQNETLSVNAESHWKLFVNQSGCTSRWTWWVGRSRTDSSNTFASWGDETTNQIAWEKIKNFGQEFACKLPSTHNILHVSCLGNLKNDSEAHQQIWCKFENARHTTVWECTQSLSAIATTLVSALALSVTQHMFPLLILAFFHETGLFEDIDCNLFAKSIPFNWLLRKHTLLQAMCGTMLLG